METSRSPTWLAHDIFNHPLAIRIPVAFPSTNQGFEQLHGRGAHFLKGDPAVFDAPFFGITSNEAAAMDPKQRWSLETAFHTFENGNFTKLQDLKGGDRTEN